MSMKVSDASKHIDPHFGPDPYFEKLIKTASCSAQHLEYMFRILWPLLASYRKVIVAQRAMTTYTALGQIAVGDRDLEYLGPGHVLYTDYPGKGKTLLAKIPAIVLGGTYGRFQGAIDNQPSDFTGNRIIDIDEHERKFFRLIKGPAYRDIILADEVNRNSSRTLAALLERLGEGKVTIFGEAESMGPAFGLFTMNPIETEGTFPLPEALLDRIMFKLTGEWFVAEQFADISERTDEYDRLRGELKQVCAIETIHEIREFFHKEVYMDAGLLEKRMGHFAEASNDPHRFGYLKAFEKMFGDRPLIRSGLSGRGFVHWVGASRAMAAFRYRNYVLPEDALKVLLPVLRHRINFEKGALSTLTSELQLRDPNKTTWDTNETTDVVLMQLIREAW